MAIEIVNCVNCGRRSGFRNGDDFRCDACGFEWDVAHEKKNATYIRSSLRREPAKTMAEMRAEADEREAARLRRQPSEDPEAPEVPSEDTPESDPLLEGMTVNDLVAMAEHEDIDLGEKTRKAEIIAAIVEGRARKGN